MTHYYQLPTALYYVIFETEILGMKYIEIIKMTKQLTSNTSYFVCEATCFAPYATIIRPSYESSQ